MSRESAKAYKHRRYLDRKTRQVCVDCEASLQNHKNVRCEQCRETLRQRRQPPPGDCQYSRQCAKPPVTGRKYCQDHLAALLERSKTKRATARKSGRCGICGGANNTDTHRCQSCRSRMLTRAKETIDTLRDRVYATYGGYLCKCCGETIRQFLSLDHINNDGNKHRKEIGSRSLQLYRWIVANNFPPTFQVLCLNCNIGRARNGGVCPHKMSHSRDHGGVDLLTESINPSIVEAG